MPNIGELTAVLGLDSSALDKASEKYKNFGKDIDKQSDQTNDSLSLVTKGLIAGAAAWVAYKAAAVAVDAVLAASRYETLGVVLETVGDNAGYAASEMNAYAQGLQNGGIAMAESRLVLTRMTQAQIDLSKSSELARIAQDAAVIGNTNSSAAFEKLIHGIQSAQVEVLRNIGINVNFEQSYAKMAKQLGKNTKQLSEQEKIQARLNVVMEAGAGISGTYEAAMDTAGKKMGSITRHIDNMMISLGDPAGEDFADVIDVLTDEIKDLDAYLSRADIQASLKDIASVMGSVAEFTIKTTAALAQFTLFVTGELTGLADDVMSIVPEESFLSNLFGDTDEITASKTAAAAEYKDFLDTFGDMFEEAVVIDPEAVAAEAQRAAEATTKALRSTAETDRKFLTERLGDYEKFYSDLQQKIEDHAQVEYDNLKTLNDLYRQQMDLRRSTEELIASLGGEEKSDAEQYRETTAELEKQYEAALLLTGQDQVAALESYKNAVGSLADEFREGFEGMEGSEVTAAAIEDIKNAYATQKEIVDELTSSAEANIETNRLWGEELVAEAELAAWNIDYLKERVVILDETIAEMDTNVDLTATDNMSATIQNIHRQIDAMRAAAAAPLVIGGGGDGTTQTISTGGGDGSATPFTDAVLAQLDGFATGTDYVKETGPAFIHKGEAIIPAAENAARKSGSTFTGDFNFDLKSENAEDIDWRRVVRDEIKPELERL